jgi:hypothetical protein
MKSDKLQFNKQFLRDINLDENKLYYKKAIYNYLVYEYNLVNKYSILVSPEHSLYKYKLYHYNYIYSCHIPYIISKQVLLE